MQYHSLLPLLHDLPLCRLPSLFPTSHISWPQNQWHRYAQGYGWYANFQHRTLISSLPCIITRASTDDLRACFRRPTEAHRAASFARRIQAHPWRGKFRTTTNHDHYHPHRQASCLLTKSLQRGCDLERTCWKCQCTFFASEQPIVSTLALSLRVNIAFHAKFEHGFTSFFSRGFDGRSPSHGLLCLLDMQIPSNVRYDKAREFFTKKLC